MSQSASPTPPSSPDPGRDRRDQDLDMPYDWSKPTGERFKSRAWNPGDRRLFTPKTFGWGYGVNFYWLAHPVRYFSGRS